MSTEPPRRRGRRDNGLDAAFYVPLADVDPRIGEHLLDVLWAAGVPAYLEPPAELPTDPMTEIIPASTLPRPMPAVDRLWVDRDRRADARTIVESEAPRVPENGGPDDDPAGTAALDEDTERQWAAIVEAYDLDVTGPVAPWPAVEDLDVTTRPADPPRPWAEPARPEPTESVEDPEEDEGHYEPPPPPPFPRPSGYSVLALAILAFGVVLIFFPVLLGIDASTGFALGVASVLGSAGIFVWRLRERHPDDPDDGAVV